MPKFFHVYPRVGEFVRIFFEDIAYNQKGRFWLGSIISQPQRIEFDTFETAFSTIEEKSGILAKAPSTYPDADGIYPTKTDIAIVGRVNTDVILRINEVHIRAGKHENNNVLKLNTKNPAQISLVFEPNTNDNGNYYSNTVISSDKIALISHNGKPQFKAAKLNAGDRERIFKEGHPIARGDVLIEALEVMRQALINHIHGYSAVPAEKTEILKKLEELNFQPILQKNIVIN
jgi:hypothetical protein